MPVLIFLFNSFNMTKVTIIGCGVVGAAIAYELSLIPQWQITVLEKNTPATGSTGAALGVLMGVISQKKKGRAWRLRQTSLKRYATLIPELEAKTGIQIPVNRQGIFKLLYTGDNLEKWDKLREFRHSEGWQLAIGDRDYVRCQCPHLNTRDLIGAVYSPQDRQIDPVKLTQALVAAATLNGVDFRFGVTVEEFGIKPDGGELLIGDRTSSATESIATDKLIIAAGLGSTPLTTALQQEVKIRPVLGQAMRLKLDSPLGREEFQPVITGDDVHLVPLGNNEYWLGATVEFPPDLGEPVADRELLETVKQKAIAFCPALANAQILSTWSGKRPRPEGIAAPIIGPLAGYSNVFLATAHYRNGVLLAPATALAIVEMLSTF